MYFLVVLKNFIDFDLAKEESGAGLWRITDRVPGEHSVLDIDRAIHI